MTEPVPCSTPSFDIAEEPYGQETGLDMVPGYRVYPPGMRSSELASEAGVNVQTLRYYERRGVLGRPFHRHGSGEKQETRTPRW